jgi:beta-lactamase regulating signal transducer with metallopeptidase domain
VGHLLQLGLTNAATTAVLALLVTGITWPLRHRRPAAVHALWLLVLLKLLAPPLWGVPLRRAAPPEPRPAAMPPQFVVEPTEGNEVEGAEEAAVMTAAQVARIPEPIDWATVMSVSGATIWAAGSVFCLTMVALRTWQFRRLRRQATPAPEPVVRRTRRIAAQFGVRHCPAVRLIPGAVCPMLYAVGGRAELLLPHGLWAQLDDDRRDTLIAHELAHLRRRDHWVRLVEVAATVLYWWNPVLWWARRSLREAEEQCCDAWVVWSMPAAVRDYMSAILEAVEFVSEPNPKCDGIPRSPRTVVPALASGLGEFRRLERRLWMIRQNESPRRLSRPGLLAVLVAAGAALPLAPTFAQVEPPKPEEHRALIVTQSSASSDSPKAEGATIVSADGQLTVTSDVKVTDGAPVVITQRSEDSRAGNVVELRDDTLRIVQKSDLERARAEVEQARANLEMATRRLKELEAQAGAGNKKPEKWEATAPARWKVTKNFADGEVASKPGNGTPESKGRGPDRDQERRMQKMEQKLEKIDQLLNELREMKQREQKDRKEMPEGGPARS